MAGKAVDGQRQHTDINQGDGQAAECFGDGLAAQAVARLGHQHHSQQVAQAAAQAKADGLRQRKALGTLKKSRTRLHLSYDLSQHSITFV